MGFFLDDVDAILSHVLYRTAVAITLLRWLVTWAIRFRSRNRDRPSFTSETIKENLVLASFGDVQWRVPEVSEMCAVCLSHIDENDLVRELRNCCHYFHKDCIDKWVDYNGQKTCPLCRAPLLTHSQIRQEPKNETSWAVERFVYLFGDDLHTEMHQLQ
ncbi:brassinosteroid-responsive RING protein 1-like [Mangifera indica]|uniref:brassinosteroid-responsive RING protein 1-like n=1 Tax=Mangifera indica TaxID=29780 RepID=UPI001CFB3A83|nr:brassinosteroid-responsive RING protein 1-like [Mangifera indica]